jgi:hypothetical protein
MEAVRFHGAHDIENIPDMVASQMRAGCKTRMG